MNLTEARAILKAHNEWMRRERDDSQDAASVQRAIDALLTATEWQPIDAAPKDGAAIMLANSQGAWIGCWHPVYQSGYRPKNPWSSLMLNHRHMGPNSMVVPSHWMPLPEPPK